DKLEEAKLKYSLEGRVKSVYSIYKKMFEHNKSFEEIFDFYALRIIVETELECYTVLGIIHDMFRSVPGRFKDYISTPKPNMYRSLHTTVIGRDGIPFEVQIRTWEMHRIAEYGLAAHWKYKTGAESRADIDQKLQWVSKLIDVEDETNDHDEFMHALKIDIFHDETFVFTPKGDVITLPQGSTVIDFAYAIHSAVGNKMVGAKINGMIVPIDRVPQNGEIVEILTSNASKGPSRDWLKIIKTGEARTKIRQWFKKEKQAENILVGRAEIDKEFKKFNRPYTDAQREEILSNVASRIGIQSVESLYNTIGYGGLSMNKVSAKLRDEFDRIVKPDLTEVTEIDVESLNKQAAPRKTSKSGGVIIDGVDGCMVKFAKCCNPLPGDELIGFITKGYGVSVHKRDCPNVSANMRKPEYEGRWVSAYWEQGASLMGTSSQYFEAMLRIYAKDSIGLLAQITVALADMRVNLVSVSTQKSSGEDIIINLTVNAKNLEHVNSIVSRLKGIDNIDDVTRGFGS
ncbi:MAG: bifunctional (p)ppGpp synthetase/guanosine-3',5'-bis(diphosphate) 3'-pyrophosphohydrolase, partial [Clostridia bacterium]|nr:bifunctional (p)ppGpp synthetase/guanosine-3',5'-bis(diphosphate) 3'-pyrophosphohydrolase [Clostridia bacterium]